MLPLLTTSSSWEWQVILQRQRQKLDKKVKREVELRKNRKGEERMMKKTNKKKKKKRDSIKHRERKRQDTVTQNNNKQDEKIKQTREHKSTTKHVNDILTFFLGYHFESFGRWWIRSASPYVYPSFWIHLCSRAVTVWKYRGIGIKIFCTVKWYLLTDLTLWQIGMFLRMFCYIMSTIQFHDPRMMRVSIFCTSDFVLIFARNTRFSSKKSEFHFESSSFEGSIHSSNPIDWSDSSEAADWAEAE